MAVGRRSAPWSSSPPPTRGQSPARERSPTSSGTSLARDKRQADDPAKIHPGLHAPEPHLDVGLEQLDERSLPLQGFPQRQLPRRDRVAQRRQVGARPLEEIAGKEVGGTLAGLQRRLGPRDLQSNAPADQLLGALGRP